jgi:hypothetical protein
MSRCVLLCSSLYVSLDCYRFLRLLLCRIIVHQRQHNIYDVPTVKQKLDVSLVTLFHNLCVGAVVMMMKSVSVSQKKMKQFNFFKRLKHLTQSSLEGAACLRFYRFMKIYVSYSIEASFSAS